MGRVYTPAELSEEWLSQPEHFKPAAEELLQTINDIVSDPDDSTSTTGALVFGSTTQGTAGRRSDLDILVTYDNLAVDASWTGRQLQEIFARIRKDWNVPIESIKYRRSDLQLQRHTLDPFFMQHLKSVSGEWVAGTNPMNWVQDRRIPLREVFMNYALSKQTKFSKVYTDTPYNEVDYKALQRAFELPSALGRKSLGLLVACEQVEDHGFHSAPKAEVVRSIGTLCVDETDILVPMQELIELDREYDELLDAMEYGSFDPLEYENYLRQFASQALPAAVDFTDRLSRFTLNRSR
jgi:predicted nucleotidyltransferase